MKSRFFFRILRRDCRGSTLLEFAILAPLLITVIVGVFQVGMQMQSYNAMRSAMSDTARNTVVQFQLNNTREPADIEGTAYGIAISPPYGLKGDRLDIDVSEVTSEVADTRKFQIQMTYQPENLLGIADIQALTLSYSRPVYVHDAGPAV